jgi:hypothetical protein
MRTRRPWHPLVGLAVFCAAGIAWMLAVACLAVLCGGCQSGDDIEPTLTPEAACEEQADAWCRYFERCGYGDWPTCRDEKRGQCLSQISEPVAVADQDQCLESLEDLACFTTTWTTACECTRQENCP